MGRKNQGKKEEIIDAMYEIFSQKGYQASMADISNIVGIKVQSIYSHYKSKDEIIKLTLEKEMNYRLYLFTEEVDKAQEKNSEEALKSIFLLIWSYYKDIKKLRFWRNISLINNEELRVWCRNIIRESEINIQQKLIIIFEKGKATGNLRYKSVDGVSNLYIAMIHGMLDWILLYQNSPINMDEVVEKTWEAYWDSISIG